MLIDKHILPAAHPADARLSDSGVSVWAIVAYLRLVDGDRERVARDYDISQEAIDAALAYYAQHRAAIDANIALNAAS